jgi:hypothetical protein
MNRHLIALFSLLGAACAPTMVANHPTTTLVSSNPKDVRDAIVRALGREGLSPESEEASHVVASYDKKVRCRYSVDFSETQFVVTTLDLAPQAPAPAEIDDKCDKEAKRVVKAIVSEIGRPAKEAKQAESRRMDHERRIADDQRRAAEANLAQQQIQQQEAENPPPQPVYVAPQPDAPPPPPSAPYGVSTGQAPAIMKACRESMPSDYFQSCVDTAEQIVAPNIPAIIRTCRSSGPSDHFMACLQGNLPR